MKWNSDLYDKKHDFVFKYGEYLVELLAPVAGERIIDLGCGTGYLTNRMAESGAVVTGIDNSTEMISKASSNYPGIDFRVISATEFNFENSCDAIFSNAVLHWVPQKEAVIASVVSSLKSGGRFVAEFGGRNNVKNIVDALRQVLRKKYPRQASLEVWYFPSSAEYATLLEDHGLEVSHLSYYKRETLLKDTENGIKDWLQMFGKPFFEGIEQQDIEPILSEVQLALSSTNYRDDQWYADYKRLRVIATKP